MKDLKEYLIEAIDAWADINQVPKFIHGYMTGYVQAKLNLDKIRDEEMNFIKKDTKIDNVKELEENRIWF